MSEFSAQLRAFLEHPGLARANLGKIPSGPGALRTIDRFMGLLRAGQLPKKVVAYAVDILPLFATAYAFEQGIYHISEEKPGHSRRYECNKKFQVEVY